MNNPLSEQFKSQSRHPLADRLWCLVLDQTEFEVREEIHDEIWLRLEYELYSERKLLADGVNND